MGSSVRIESVPAPASPTAEELAAAKAWYQPGEMHNANVLVFSKSVLVARGVHYVLTVSIQSYNVHPCGGAAT